jgi:hypothetical protein
MELEIVCAPSAFKHGVSEADIHHAITTARYDRMMEGFDDKVLLLGFNTKGNPLEVVYRRVGDNGMYVFHAMKCRNTYLPLLL